MDQLTENLFTATRLLLQIVLIGGRLRSTSQNIQLASSRMSAPTWLRTVSFSHILSLDSLLSLPGPFTATCAFPLSLFCSVRVTDSFRVNRKYWPQEKHSAERAGAYFQQDAAILQSLKNVCESSDLDLVFSRRLTNRLHRFRSNRCSVVRFPRGTSTPLLQLGSRHPRRRSTQSPRRRHSALAKCER